MTIQSVKLAKLVLSPINVRQAGEDFIEQLAADIAARGLIQNLIVTPAKKPRGTFAVIAGSRRLRALELLAQRGDIDAASYDVPVLVLSGSDALLSETSLAENFQKLAMNPADECRAFQHFMGTGGDIDGVARRFGITRRFVEGRLRLADLAEPIFTALAERRISLDIAKAYASTASQDRQLMVWQAYGNQSYQSADSIRRIIANETMKSSEPVARYVGEAAYVAAGGKVENDLFSDDGDRWVDPGIAQTLAAAKLEAEALRLGEEQGLAWVRPIAGTSTWEAARDLHRIHLPTLPLTLEQAERLDTIATRLEEIEDAMQGVEGDEDEATYAALEEEHETLSDEAQEIHDRPQILPDELKQKVGTFLLLGRDGTTTLDTTYYSETPIRVVAIEPDADGDEDKAGEDGGERAPRGFHIEEGPVTTGRSAAAPVAPEAEAPGGKALSQVLYDQLTVQRRDVLAASILANPALALDYLLFAMIDGRVNMLSHSGTTIRASHPQDPMLAKSVPATRARDYLAEAYDGLDASWTEACDKSSSGAATIGRFEAFRALGDEAKTAWLAWIVAASFEAKDGYTAKQNALQNRLATILDIDVATWWRPTAENFFDRVSKGVLLSLLDEVGGPALSARHASQKKPEIAASCEKLFAGEAIVEAEVKAAALAWVPNAMRFLDQADDADTGNNDDADAGFADLIVSQDPGIDDDDDAGDDIGDDIDIADLIGNDPDDDAANINDAANDEIEIVAAE
ncbi:MULTISPECIES: ParB/RepB/Spo0J family partition protein [Sphingomonas]|jgi:ParB family chromosome partitioning protein|uniref:ParB family chromosome partitioning protein n=1 Tax=Sphingomonas abaci TaxID=237611 RepID=A0A7W7ALB5_9SPHN|nr:MULTISPECIES: ParB/RepB/Spo0J family partition protein [Sphingomonas]ATI56819.1 chromosome partitioning protein ParB [Sphingomonas melonis]MBB4619163.1 ParB family chromosome partitioning protein [Sphingomonas abaci]MBX8846458.1 ParB/RepB/Spo0J family partition protein [Sphingomonas melonis]MBX8855592.1 ParB/RepB/Spo0J family partition protein [Sphingomonas melonis]MBX8900601.1 ParB/RepB/Spo0J family partition protein [Sphingomonas melonis]